MNRQSGAILMIIAGLMLGGIAWVGGSQAELSIAGLTPTPTPADELPWMNLPRPLREWNWGGGSCVHASTVHSFRWMHKPELAAWWRKTYSGGESAHGLTSKLNKAGVRYYCTTSGDPAVLEYCSATRRGAVIFYYPNHSITFAGYARKDGEDWAVLLDNNRIDRFIWVPKKQFLREWRGYGGFALTPLFSPTPRIPVAPFR